MLLSPSSPQTSSEDIEIGIYLDREFSGNTAGANELAATIERAFADALPERELHIGPVDLIDIPDGPKSTTKGLLDWWSEGTIPAYRDSNLLVVPYNADWNYGGYGEIGGSTAVMMGGGMLNTPVYKWIALHEIGHNFGLTHEHGEVLEVDDELRRTPMVNGYEGTAQLTYSDDAIEALT